MRSINDLPDETEDFPNTFLRQNHDITIEEEDEDMDESIDDGSVKKENLSDNEEVLQATVEET